MPVDRRRPRARARGSWLPRLAGFGAIVLLAAGGVTAYVVEFQPHHATAQTELPSKVVSYQSVGLVARPPASTSGFVQLVGSRGVLSFAAVPAAAQQQGTPQWTADLMTGNSYIFISLANGDCLAVSGKAKLALQHCDLRAQQRWRRVGKAVQLDGHSFYEYASMASGQCISQASVPGQLDGAALAPCFPQATAQLIAFWWESV